MYASIFHRLLRMSLALVGLVLFGTMGYMTIENWSPLDGAYMTVITLSTVGYGETNALSPAGRGFTVVLIAFSLVGVSLWTASITSFFVENDLRDTFNKSRKAKMISKLRQHAIVCGATQIGLFVAEQLIAGGKSVVIVDPDEARLKEVSDRLRSVLTVAGNSTDEMILTDAGLLDAKYIVAATDSDIDNLLIAITCKDLGRSIHVSARCEDYSVANRMRKAGVDADVNPSQLVGQQMVSLIS